MLRRGISGPALVLTLLLHGMLLLAVVAPPPVPRPPLQPPAMADETLVRIRLYAEGQSLHTKQQTGDSGTAVAEEPCDGDFYVGIGVVAGSYTGQVILVAPGAPAARAGIRAGEEIVNAEVLGANRYAEGTPLELHVAGPDGTRRWVSLKVEKICNA